MALRKTHRSHGLAACFLALSLLVACGDGDGATNNNNQAQTCEASCPDVMAAGCAIGPPSLQECEAGCADVLLQCPLAFDALMQCGGAAPTYSCGTDGYVYMDNCVDEHEAIYACMEGVPESCVLSCPDVMASGCAMIPSTLEECYDGCGDTTVDCPTEYAAVIQCGGVNPSYSCGPGGMVYIDGCEAEHNEVYACVWETLPSCVISCPLVMAAGCTNGPSDLQDCFTGCASAATDCPTEYDALTACAGTSPTYSCGTNDMVLTDNCVTEHEALYTCLGIN